MDRRNFERGRREAFETHDALAKRASIEAEAASAQRSRLERGSPSAGRRNFPAMLNSLVADAAARELPGLEALQGVRKAQRLGRRSATAHNVEHACFEKSGGLESFNRLRKDDIAVGDAETKSKYDPSGSLAAIQPEWLLEAARLLIAAARARAASAPAGRRD
jgi:hypothetical protein